MKQIEGLYNKKRFGKMLSKRTKNKNTCLTASLNVFRLSDLKKLQLASISFVLIISTILIVPEAALALGGPAPPGILLIFEPVSQPFANGCSANYTVRVISQIGFQGEVNLTVINLPTGVTATLKPSSVVVPESEEAASLLTVRLMPDAPQGKFNLTVRGVSADGKASDTENLTISNISSPCGRSTTESLRTTTITTTTTILSTHPESQPVITTVSTTLTKTITNTSTEQVTNSITFAWAIGATIIAAILALVVVRRRR